MKYECPQKIINAVHSVEMPPYDKRLAIDETSYANHTFWPKLIRLLEPAHVLELGTGDGRTASLVMTSLSATGRLTTINKQDDSYRFGKELDSFLGDQRLLFIVGDSRDPNVRDKIASCQCCKRAHPRVDLFFIDSDHYASIAYNEWCLMEPILADEAVVIIDDLTHNDMHRFWSAIPYNKFDYGGQGMFIYHRDRRTNFYLP